MKKQLLTFFVTSLCIFGFTTGFSQEKNEEEKSQKLVLQDMLDKMDDNKDGKLTLGEAKGTLLLNFTTLDLNKDGVLTREDLENFDLPEKPTPQ